MIYCMVCLLLNLSLACSDSKDELQMFEIEASLLTQDFNQYKGGVHIPVNTNLDNSEWRTASDATWCRAIQSKQENKPTIYVEVDDNTASTIRVATVRITSPVKNYEIRVRQLGSESTILINQQSFPFDAVGGELEFVVTTNVDVEVIVPDWITKTPTNRAGEMTSTTYKYLVTANNADDARQADIEVREVLPANITGEPIREFISVTQKGLSSYEVGEIGDQLKDDIRLKIVSGVASSYNSTSESIEKSFDGDITTIYHSKYSDANKYPFTLTYTLEKMENVDYFVYYPRSDGGVNGNLGVVEVLYSTTGNDPFVLLKEVDLGSSRTPAMITFDNTVQAKSIRFSIKSGVGGHASCAEMEFYARNTESFDYLTLFTDETCSELKPGITEEEISACLYPFFKNMAYYMYQNKYPREFRIANYKAYPHPDIQAAMYKTSQHSLLDNPTGISVKKDETLVVMVGDPQGNNISLRVHNLKPPTGQLDGYNYYKNYPLKRGINKLTMEDDGLVYVMYHTSTLEAAETLQPVKIHFASGEVNGYFDTQNPDHAGRWTELLNKATNSYFDLVGKDVHMTFETAAFKQYTGTKGVELANLMDSVVHSEQRLLGLYKFEERFRNRIYMHVMYNTELLYAASYHTGYHMNSQKTILDPVVFPSDCWGVAHEIGHVYQTRPGVRWAGMTEVTNNIMSQYIQTSILNQPSRLQSENYYSPAQEELFLGEKAFCESSSVFHQLVPFWQLELYFGNVLGMTPLRQPDQGGFYPNVYQYARQKDYTGMDNGEMQLDFIYNCCLASGVNLIDFFERWGFLKPVNKVVDDYDISTLLITESMVTELRNKVNALGYPAPMAALEYITDNTVDMFNRNLAIVKGSAEKNGSLISLNNWKNVVAFEIKDASGSLISIESGTATSVLLPDGATLYAVSANGTRLQVSSN